MTEAAWASVDPFSFGGGPVDDRTGEQAIVRAALRQAGPVVRVAAPAGGTVWIVTEDTLAREVFGDPKFAKDPALAPPHWHGREGSLEPPATERCSLTTTDGKQHLKLRRVHAPAFTSRRLRAHADRVATIARELLTEAARSARDSGRPADLTTGFTYRFPLTVLCDLLGVPIRDLGKARQASEAMAGGGPDDGRVGLAALEELVTAATHAGRTRGEDTLAGTLYERAQAELDDVSANDMHYMITGLIFAGHHTTGSLLGLLLARLLAGHLDAGTAAGAETTADETAVDGFVEETLRLHPPAPHSLWRFTTSEVELAGVHLPAGAPVLIDIEGINTDPRGRSNPGQLQPARTAGSTHLTFGDGPHYCIGAHLARVEAHTAVQVMRTDFPHAQLAAPFDQLELAPDPRTRRLVTLPVWLDN